MEKYIGTIFTKQKKGFDTDIKSQAPNYVKYDPTKKLKAKKEVFKIKFLKIIFQRLNYQKKQKIN